LPSDIYTLPLHDALPIWLPSERISDSLGADAIWPIVWNPSSFSRASVLGPTPHKREIGRSRRNSSILFSSTTTNASGFFKSEAIDRKSTRLNSSHQIISY